MSSHILARKQARDPYTLSHCCVWRTKLHSWILWTVKKHVVYRFAGCPMRHTHTQKKTFPFVSVEEYTHSALHTDSNLFVQPMQCDSISLSLNICARIIYKNTCWIGSAMCGTFFFFFAHPHFISLRFVRENRTPLGAFALLRQFLSLDSLLSLLVCFFPPPDPSVSRVSPPPELSFSISHTLTTCLLAHVNNH